MKRTVLFIVWLSLSNTVFGQNDSASIYFREAQSKNRKGDNCAAVELLKKSISLNPTDSAYSWIGKLKEWTYDIPGAYQSYTLGIQLGTQLMEDFYLERGDLNRIMGHGQQAIVDYEMGYTLNPNGIFTYRIGDVRDSLKSYAETIEKMKNANTKDTLFYAIRGKAEFGLGQFSLAFKDLKKAVKLYPTSAQNFFIKATCEIRKGLVKEALVDMRRAADLGHQTAKRQLDFFCIH